MLPLDACAARADVGKKAETLARMRAAGLRAPDGFVVLAEENVDGAELSRELARIGGARFAVRSSSPLEDRAGGSAAGLFESVVGVPAGDVAAAIARVRESASSPALRAYLAARGASGDRVALPVLVQPHVDAPTYAVAHSAGSEFFVEERRAGEPEWGDVQARRIARDDPGALAAGLRTLETIVGGPVDAELAREGETITWLQARPLARAIDEHDWHGRLTEPGRWRLDAEHNPDPLSAAQASLVGFVDTLGVGARQRVVDGYLYVEADAPPRGLSPIDPRQLRERFTREIVPDCLARLERARDDGAVQAALSAFGHVYRRYVGEVSPSLSRVKRDLDRFFRDEIGEPLARHADLLAGLGGETLARDQALWDLGRGNCTVDDYLLRFGDHAPAWDVAVPTDRERIDDVRARARELAKLPAPSERHASALQVAQHAQAALAQRLRPSVQPRFAELLQIARETLPIAEDDDLLFLRAQSTMRQALLRRAGELDLSAPDDVFELALADIASPTPDLRARAAANRAARAAAARRVPPAAFSDGRPEWITPPAHGVLRGHGTSGQARGQAVVVRSLADAPSSLPPRAILVVAAIVPSLTPLLSSAVALVTDHGGALSHGATLAREYGVPAVLGVGSATSLPDGTELYVDADRGRVLILDRV